VVFIETMYRAIVVGVCDGTIANDRIEPIAVGIVAQAVPKPGRVFHESEEEGEEGKGDCGAGDSKPDAAETFPKCPRLAFRGDRGNDDGSDDRVADDRQDDPKPPAAGKTTFGIKEAVLRAVSA
jgi:hypothetical protein